MTDDGRKDFLLAALRAGCLRARLMANELEAVGVALGHDLVDPHQAAQWIAREGLMFLLAIPEALEDNDKVTYTAGD